LTFEEHWDKRIMICSRNHFQERGDREGKDAIKLKNLLDVLDEKARMFAELGVNSHHKIPQKLIGTRIDDAVAGHIHIGLGRNDHIGGRTSTDAHLDLLMTWATLLLDGKPILEDGVLKI